MAAPPLARQAPDLIRACLERAAHRGWVGGVGALASLLLHLMLVGAMLSGASGHRRHRPVQPGVGSTAAASDTEPTMTLIFFEEPGIGAKQDEPRDEDLASRGQTTTNPKLTVAKAIPSVDAASAPADDQKADSLAAEASASDQQGQAKMFGLYMGQIQARIERAWLRPRTPIGEDIFECRVQIAQNKQGEVLEVMLRECKGDPRWQVSLVHAIERASPLPAPPDPAVFTDALRLSFQSGPYMVNGSDEGFEPLMPTPVVVAYQAPPPMESEPAPAPSESTDFDNSNP